MNDHPPVTPSVSAPVSVPFYPSRYALVIGGGPAGLMAAQELAQAGHRVVLAESKATLGRKFLMAGRSGLNISKNEPIVNFLSHYDSHWLDPMIKEFGPEQIVAWCQSLGQQTFIGSSGRIFPTLMKAAPLLRAWITHLRNMNVSINTSWHWQGWAPNGAFKFHTPSGTVELTPSVVVLALGGASWPKLGSDAAWLRFLAPKGVDLTPFKPANMGFVVNWSSHMQPYFGQAVKNVVLKTDVATKRGEFVISSQGIEGGAVYTISRYLRDAHMLHLDLLPDVALSKVQSRINNTKAKDSKKNQLRKLSLPPTSIALILEFGRYISLEKAIKNLSIPIQCPYPIEKAISVAGGIKREALTGQLELKAVPRTFACGEMLDWEASTGGYLLTGCLASGRWAGRAAANLLGESKSL